MIRIHGSREGDSEWVAGEELRKRLVSSAPVIGTSPHYDVNIIVSAQTPGQRSRVSDIDLVILGNFARPWRDEFEIVQLGEGRLPVDVWSFAATIEVKSHDPSGIRIDGNRVYVRYREGWHDATQQSIRQREALREYLTANTGSAPYIVNLLWLRSVLPEEVETLGLPVPHNILTAEISYHALLERLVNLNLPAPDNERYTYGVQNIRTLDMSRAVSLLTRRLQLTSLDRQKTEQITARRIDLDWIELAGSKQIVLRGRGGSGKTLTLLRGAYQWYLDGLRVLILTYNTALVADLRRQMTILQIGQDIASPSIRVMTVHAFMMNLVDTLLGKEGRVVDSEWFNDRYPERLRELLTFIEEGALADEDVIAAVRLNDAELGWDFICVDEGQDWLDDERDILHLIYGPEKLLIAEGRDQLVRRNANCNWAAGSAVGRTKVVRLTRCLRMKQNLVVFANALASELGLIDWALDDSGAIPGGRILIYGGHLMDEQTHKSISSDNAAAGNRNIDMLYCVAPASTNADGFNEGDQESPLASVLREWGYKTWDATNREERLTYPTSVDQCRIVQIDSSRGLEGWTVFLNGLDRFYDHKVDMWKRESTAFDEFSRAPEAWSSFASLWSMIPVTRAIDTLVIVIENQDSIMGKAILKVANRLPDIVESELL